MNGHVESFNKGPLKGFAKHLTLLKSCPNMFKGVLKLTVAFSRIFSQFLDWKVWFLLLWWWCMFKKQLHISLWPALCQQSLLLVPTRSWYQNTRSDILNITVVWDMPELAYESEENPSFPSIVVILLHSRHVITGISNSASPSNLSFPNPNRSFGGDTVLGETWVRPWVRLGAYGRACTRCFGSKSRLRSIMKCQKHNNTLKIPLESVISN